MPATSLLISHHEMQIAQDRGSVGPLCRDIPEFCKWYGAWWLLSADGWLRITDSHLASRLDRIKMRLDTAEEQQVSHHAQEARQEEQVWPAL